MDATKGNKGLLNYTPTTDVYVHIGVITTASAHPTDWKHSRFDWGQTPGAANATYIGNNKWQYTITGGLRTYFGITDPNERILKIAILFRSGNGSRAQRNADGSDMYVPVYTSDLAVRINQPFREPKFVPVAEPVSLAIGNTVTVTAVSNKASTLKLYHNSATPFATATNAQTITATTNISVVGNQQIIAEANDGTTVRYDTINLFVSPPGSPTAALPAGVRDGINYEPGDTSVTLVLRAPGKTIVSVIGDFNNWTQATNHIMNKTPDGNFFWIRLHPLTPATEYAYQYVIDNSLRIADPYTEKVLDPANDRFISSTTYPNLKSYPAGQTGIVSVLQTRQSTYNWSAGIFNRPDKRGLVIYELLLRDFVAAHDWKTLRDTLGYLQKLGINAIQLMPFNEFEGNESWGYNPSFYFAPDKYYGTKNALKEFIDSAHKRGIAVIMDIALNHSFGQSPMVQMYWDGTNNRPAANNPWFNPVAKHAYNVGYDFNHESSHTKYFVGRVVEHWLQEFRIDGFRFDLSKGFTQKQTCDNNGNNCNEGAMAAYDASRIAILKGYYDTTQVKSTNSYLILEHFAVDTEERELSDYGMLLWNNLNYNYSEAAMGYIANSNLDRAIHATRGFTKPHLVTYAESHDEERIVYKNLNFGAASGSYNIKDTATALKRMELASAFLLTIPGPKMIWQFGELGYDHSINRCPDGTINNNCRLSNKPIPWHYLNDQRRKNVYNTYSSLLQLRQHPWYKEVFLSGTIDRSLNGTIKWIKVSSASDTSDLLVVGNFGLVAEAAAVTFQTAGTWFDYFSNTTFTTTGAAQSIQLQPGEYRVFVNRNVNNIAVTSIRNIPWNGTTLNARVFPNPANSNFTLQLKMPQSGNLSISLYNITGQFVLPVYNGFVQEGNRDINLKKLHVAPGIYYLKVETKKEISTLPFTIQ